MIQDSILRRDFILLDMKIQKAYDYENNSVEKAEAQRHIATPGTIHTHSDGYKYQKQNDGSWTKLSETHNEKPPIDIKEKGNYWNKKIYGNDKYGHQIYVDDKKIDITPEQKKYLDQEKEINEGRRKEKREMDEHQKSESKKINDAVDSYYNKVSYSINFDKVNPDELRNQKEKLKESMMKDSELAEQINDEVVDGFINRLDHEKKIHDKIKQRKYLNVPFEEKDEAKANGARWDEYKKKWYHEPDHPNPEKFDKWR